MRKVFIVCFCVLLLIGCAIPAFGISEQPEQGEYLYYSDLQFDTVDVSGVGVYEWPFNVSAPNSVMNFTYDRGVTGRLNGSSASNYSVNFSGYFSSPSDTGFSLNAQNIVFRPYDDDSFYFVRGSEDILLTSVRLSFWVYSFVRDDVSEEYVFDSVSFSESLSISNNEVDLVSALSTMLSDFDQQVFIADLTVSFSYSRLNVNTPEIYILCASSPEEPISNINSWMTQQDFPYNVTITNPAYFDVGTWLTTAIGSFLSFEFAPGFSIDTLLGVVLILGVLFWIISLLL